MDKGQPGECGEPVKASVDPADVTADSLVGRSEIRSSVGGSLRNARTVQPGDVSSFSLLDDASSPSTHAPIDHSREVASVAYKKPVNRPITSKSAIIYNASQRRNPVLALIKNVALEVGDIQADYQVGATTGVLFLSLRYHRLHPEYLHTRIEKLQGVYLLRILLVLCDVTEHHQSLREITKTCLVNNLTVLVAWTNEEVATYLQILKASEHKSADSLKERVHQSYHAQLESCLTSGKKIQKPDVWTLAGNLGSFASIANAGPQQLSVLPGLGPVKVKSLTDAFTQPFKASPRPETSSMKAAQASVGVQAVLDNPAVIADDLSASSPTGTFKTPLDPPWNDPLDDGDDGDAGPTNPSTTRHIPAPPKFLLEYLPTPCSDFVQRPHVTVTFAQSSDGKIAGPGGARVAISGKESMEMTHCWMRMMHDSILVGIGTLLLDDPRLQVTGLPAGIPQPPPPQPIILDPKLRFPMESRLLQAWSNSRTTGDNLAKQPWLLCGKDVSPSRIQDIEAAGARVIPVDLDADGRIPAGHLPEILQLLSLRSLMVEGGSHVISSFLKASRSDGTPLADLVIVTMAPMIIGDGVGVVPQGEDRGLPVLKPLHIERLGIDWVMVCATSAEKSTDTFEGQVISMLNSMLDPQQ